MARLLTAVLAVFVVIFAVPVVVYGAVQSVTGLPIPGGASPLVFLAGVAVSKAGTALAFCLIFRLARDALAGRWLLYAFLWWLMFAFGEVGQAIGPGYSWTEALAGIVSEAVYLPVSAFIVRRLLAPA
jgi:hypothetical protein